MNQYVNLESRPLTAEAYVSALATIPGLLDLAKNPFLLTLALEILPSIVKDKQGLSTVMMTRCLLFSMFASSWFDVNKRRLQNSPLNKIDRGKKGQLFDRGFVSQGLNYVTRLAEEILVRLQANSISPVYP